jgi:hypothetical protein
VSMTVAVVVALVSPTSLVSFVDFGTADLARRDPLRRRRAPPPL